MTTAEKTPKSETGVQAVTVQPVKRSIRLFLTSSAFYGISLNGLLLLGSLYLLSLGFSKEQVGLVNSGAYLLVLIMGIFVGAVSDRYGNMKVMIAGGFLCVTANGVMLLMEIPILVGIFYAVSILGFSIFEINRSPAISAIAGPSYSQRMFSLSSAVFNIAGAVGTYITGWLPVFFAALFSVPRMSAFSYRGALWVNVGAFFVCVLTMFFLKIPTHPIQDTHLKPAFSFRALRDPNLQSIGGLFFLYGLATIVISNFISVYYVETFRLPVNQVGMVIALQVLFSGLGALASARLATLVKGVIRLISLSWVFLLLIMVGMALAQQWWLSAFLYLMRGFFLNIGYILLIAYAMAISRENERGLASALVFASWMLGSTIGSSFSGLIVTEWGYTPLLILSGLIFSLGGIFAWLRFRQKDL